MSQRAIDRARRRREGILRADLPPEPYTDHRVYPQGWSYAMIEREAARRYASTRDVDRKFDWTWCLDTIRERYLSDVGYRVACDYYEHQQAGWFNDKEREEAVGERGRSVPYGWLWARDRSATIAGGALSHVMNHADLTAMRAATFDAVFHYTKPSLEWVRAHGRPSGPRYNSRGRVICMNQRETIQRIQWCVEVLTEHFADRDMALGRVA